MSSLNDLLHTRGIQTPPSPRQTPISRPTSARTGRPPIIHQVKQGTTGWLELRAGIPTASCFDMILTPGGKPSKSAERYLRTLLAERCMGHPVIEHVSMWQQRGSQLEAEAVNFYEMMTDIETVPVGFVTNADGTVGASPDRFVGDHGTLEIKCPSEWVHMGSLLQDGSVYEAHKIQVLGQLWITGRDFADVLSFHPEMPPALIHVERDEAFINLLEAAVTAFSRELERQFAICVERGWVNHKKRAPRRDPLPPMDSLSDLVKAALIAGNKIPEGF